MGTFSYRETEYTGTFGELLTAELPTYVSQVDGIEVVSRQDIAALLEEKDFWISDLVNPGTVPKVPKGFTAVTALLRGKYFLDKEGPVVRVLVEVVNVANGAVVSSAAMSIDRNSIPVSISAAELAQAEALSGKLQIVQAAVGETSHVVGTEAPNIRVWAKDGRSVFSEGDEIVLAFWSDRDCYLRLFDVTPDGSTKMIFPNRFHRDALIRGRKVYELPGADMDFKFLVTEPFGPEAVLAVATVSRTSSGVLTRGLPNPGEGGLDQFVDVPGGVKEIAELILGAKVKGTRGIDTVPSGPFSEARWTFVTQISDRVFSVDHHL